MYLFETQKDKTIPSQSIISKLHSLAAVHEAPSSAINVCFSKKSPIAYFCLPCSLAQHFPE